MRNHLEELRKQKEKKVIMCRKCTVDNDEELERGKG